MKPIIHTANLWRQILPIEGETVSMKIPSFALNIKHGIGCFLVFNSFEDLHVLGVFFLGH